MAQINKAKILYEGIYGDILPKFKKITANIRKFNGNICKYSVKTVANGKQFYVHYKGDLIAEVSILNSRYGAEIMHTTYKKD